MYSLPIDCDVSAEASTRLVKRDAHVDEVLARQTAFAHKTHLERRQPSGSRHVWELDFRPRVSVLPNGPSHVISVPAVQGKRSEIETKPPRLPQASVRHAGGT
jgi:hypothetical protein